MAIVFGVKRFHQHLFGRKFTILSDHKPLQYLLGETRGIPAMASARIQHWALTLSAYNYVINYKPGVDHANADGLSRLPLPDHPGEVPLPGEMILLFEALHNTPLRATQIKECEYEITSAVAGVTHKNQKYSCSIHGLRSSAYKMGAYCGEVVWWCPNREDKLWLHSFMRDTRASPA